MNDEQLSKRDARVRRNVPKGLTLAQREAWLYEMSPLERDNFRREERAYKARLRRMTKADEKIREGLAQARLEGDQARIDAALTKLHERQDMRRYARDDYRTPAELDPRDREFNALSTYEQRARVRDWRAAGASDFLAEHLAASNKRFYNATGLQLREFLFEYRMKLRAEGESDAKIDKMLNDMHAQHQSADQGKDLDWLFEEAGIESP